MMRKRAFIEQLLCAENCEHTIYSCVLVTVNNLTSVDWPQSLNWQLNTTVFNILDSHSMREAPFLFQVSKENYVLSSTCKSNE